DRLRTNRRAPMLEITRDDTGRHDMLIAACDPWRYEYDFGVTGHRSCSDNFVEALRPWKLERHRLPQPVNFFQNMSYPDGRVEFGESLARPGDTVELLALMSVIAAVSACPMDLNPISCYRVKARVAKAAPLVDITFTTSHVGRLYMSDGLFQKLDMAKLPNARDLAPEARRSDAHLGVWAYVYTIAYRPDQVKMDITKWADLWD